MNDFPDLQSGISLAQALRRAPCAMLENRILIGHALQLRRIDLITQSERLLTADEVTRLTSLLRRRLQGEPIAYLVGEREFFSLTMQVTPDVLIPRPETELLVELALERLPPQGRALDLGTGSGAIAVAIAHTRPDVYMIASDISAKALQVAASNVQRHAVQVALLHSDWYAALGDVAPDFDLIVSNPPYIAVDDAHLAQGDVRFEPSTALTDHADGLSAFCIIVEGAGKYLKPGGWLLLEHGYDQSDAVQGLLKHHAFSEVQNWRDLAGLARVSGGKFGSKLAHQAAAF